jgi:hypothetical protein
VSSNRPLIYKPGTWFPIPNNVGNLLTALSHKELVLYIALCARGRGRARTVTFSNADIMRVAGITREKTFRAARAALRDKHKVIEFTKADNEGIVYDYEIFDTPGLRPDLSALDTETTATPARYIPPEMMHVILSPQPSLEGRKRRTKSEHLDGH